MYTSYKFFCKNVGRAMARSGPNGAPHVRVTLMISPFSLALWPEQIRRFWSRLEQIHQFWPPPPPPRAASHRPEFISISSADSPPHRYALCLRMFHGGEPYPRSVWRLCCAGDHRQHRVANSAPTLHPRNCVTSAQLPRLTGMATHLIQW
jgi:hypothetical protein